MSPLWMWYLVGKQVNRTNATIRILRRLGSQLRPNGWGIWREVGGKGKGLECETRGTSMGQKGRAGKKK